MAKEPTKLIPKQDGDCKIECYSERGILSYFFFSYLPQKGKFSSFIQKIGDYSGREVIHCDGQICDVVIFSELELGKRDGFGCPDGAISFVVGNSRYFIFIEAKINESYLGNCDTCFSSKSPMDDYNSCIKGQLELKMRYANQVFHPNPKFGNYVIEDESLRNFYGCARKDICNVFDRFYKGRTFDGNKENFRRVKLVKGDGVERLTNEYIAKCDPENILYLVITKEQKEINPFLALDTKYQPLFPNLGWEEICKKLFWIPACYLEDCMG